MRKATIIALFCLMLTGIAIAGDSGNGCKLQGTWIGEVPMPPFTNPDGSVFMSTFMVTYHGTGDNKGTEVVEWINLPPGFLPKGVSASMERGVWEKSGPNRYDYTTLVYRIWDATGQIVLILRASGTKILIDCDTMSLETTYEFLLPDGTIIGCSSGIVEGSIHRMRVQKQPVCELE
ncbi:MAG: hypothetical protein JXA73_08355 [Acidobacteria bacterium]|nr:hypothetical protein [Acidobacteriota bacterium]